MNNPHYFLDLLKLDVDKHRIIAVVGGGGKTSLIFRLTEELTASGKKVIVTTTTHMAYDASLPQAAGGELSDVKKMLRSGGFVVAANVDKEKGKFAALSEERLEELKNLCDVMLIEADGAKRLPLKVPEEWEPVIPEMTDAVIGVIGLDCLGSPIREKAHRVELTAKFLQKGPEDLIAPEDIVKIAASARGLFKNVGQRDYRVYLNKTDVFFSEKEAEKIAAELKKEGIAAVYGSLKEEGQKLSNHSSTASFVPQGRKEDR